MQFISVDWFVCKLIVEVKNGRVFGSATFMFSLLQRELLLTTPIRTWRVDANACARCAAHNVLIAPNIN